MINKLYILYIGTMLFVACKQKITKNNGEQLNTTETVASTKPVFKNDAHKLVYNMVQKVGTFQDLMNKNDVEYTYTYTMPNGKEDISTEKYKFGNELSYGKYEKHERTFPQLEGTITQSYNGDQFLLKNKDSLITDPKMIKMVKFKRHTNYYWFTMFQKLLDEGLNYEEIVESPEISSKFKVVKITFGENADKKTDTYQIYINKETGLIDQFLFTVIDFGKTEPMLMKVAYVEVDGMLLPAKRKYQQSNWNAEIKGDQWIQVNWTNIKFNTGIKDADFSI